ncbi:MAG: GWxTD domain-containing protein [Ignavibacteria bacterium]|nr:GWxTD domain-containing protein [Ignavibacteria bacterium]
MRLIVYLLSILFGIFIYPTVTNSQNIPLTIDAAQFRYDDTHVLWEMYYSYADTSVRYVSTNKDTYVGSMYFSIQISSSIGIIASNEWISDNTIDHKLTSHSKNLIGQKSYVLLPGQYNVDILIKDINDTTRFSKRSFPIILRSIPSNKLALSDVQIASSIEYVENSSQENQQFVKSKLNVLPNPGHECIGNSPTLSLYTEIYNATSTAKDSIDIEYKITDGAKREQFILLFKKKIVGNSQIETTSIPLDALPSGVYFVEVIIKPSDNSNDSTSVKKKFFVLNPEMPAELLRTFSEDELFQTSEFATLSPERIQDEFVKAKVLATQADVRLFEALTEISAKQKFLFRFWKERDFVAETPQNERLEEFRKAIKHANTFYSNLLIKDGWRTDPGRVLRKYGFPTQIDRYPANSESRPYEEWLYANIQGGVKFQFVDLKGIGNYVQVNSTALGEPRNDSWKERYVLVIKVEDDVIR